MITHDNNNNNNNENENNNEDKYENEEINIEMVEEENTTNFSENSLNERKNALLSKIKICKQLNKDIKSFNRVKEEIENDIDNTICFLNHYKRIRQNNILIRKAVTEKRLSLAHQIIKLDDISGAIDANLIGYEIEKKRIVDEIKELNFLNDSIVEENSFLFDDDLQFTNNKIDYWKYYRSNYDDDSDDNSGKPGIIDFR